MPGSDSKATYDNFFPVPLSPLLPALKNETGFREERKKPPYNLEGTCMFKPPLVSRFPKWGMWSGQQNCN